MLAVPETSATSIHVQYPDSVLLALIIDGTAIPTTAASMPLVELARVQDLNAMLAAESIHADIQTEHYAFTISVHAAQLSSGAGRGCVQTS